jgi:uncharacterized protein YwgA
MERTQSYLTIVELIKRMKQHGSWCGETHVQKATFFLKELFEVQLDESFILYKHGPFSFDLRKSLTEMRAHGFLSLVSQPYPYGPSLEVNEQSSVLESKIGPISGDLAERIEKAAEVAGDKGVGALERVATALWVKKEDPSASEDVLARRLTEIKPHVSLEAATEALRTVESLREESVNLQKKL